MSGRHWSAIHTKANVQPHCMTWLFAYFDVSWVVHGGPQSQVPCWGMEGVEEVSGRHWSAIHREANVQAQCMTWLFAYFDVSWVVHGGPRSQVPCLGRDSMEVRRG